MVIFLRHLTNLTSFRLQSYPLNLPYMKDHSGTWWVLEATLGFDFLSGNYFFQ